MLGRTRRLSGWSPLYGWIGFARFRSSVSVLRHHVNSRHGHRGDLNLSCVLLQVIVWKLDESRAVCGGPAGNDQTLCVKWLNQRNDRFVTGGYFSLRVWHVRHTGTPLRVDGHTAHR
jgi:hypothetical protein